MYRIVLLPLAGKDIRMAMKWYEDKSYELGQKFREEVFLQIDKLKNDFIERSSVLGTKSCIFEKISLCYILSKKSCFWSYNCFCYFEPEAR